MTLADGRRVVYHYAWRGGPRLTGEPGTPEFVASFNAAVAAKLAPETGVLQELLVYYQENTEFTELAPRTRADYVKQIAIIEREFGDLPLAALPDPETRGVFKRWRATLAKRSKRQADYAFAVLGRVLSVAKDHGKIRVNPVERSGRLYGGSRRDKVWSLDQEAAYLAEAPEHMRLPILLGAWTGQRQGDLLRLRWTDYDGKWIRLRQSKTGVFVQIPVVDRLKEALDAEKARKRGLLVLLTKKGQRWSEHGFRVSWRKACTKAGISGLTFHDLRGTSVHRLALAGCTEVEIAVFTGLAIGDVRGILEKHYLHRDPKLAESAGAKLEKLSETGTDDPNSVK